MNIANDMKITIDGFKVYDSGSVITHENKSVLFEIKTIKVLISFKNDETREGVPIDIKSIEGNAGLEITLVNFSGPSTGFIRPLDIGFLEGERLYLQLMVQTLGNTGTRELSYTWLTKAVQQ